MANLTKKDLQLEVATLETQLQIANNRIARLDQTAMVANGLLRECRVECRQLTSANAMLMDDLQQLATKPVKVTVLPIQPLSPAGADWWSRMRWFTIGAALAIAALSLVGCSSPVAPSSPLMPLTVRVYEYGTASPLTFASVETSEGRGCTTDASGECQAAVPAQVDVTVTARAAGHQAMAYTGSVASLERWTFFLPKE